MLIACPDGERMCRALEAAGIPAAVIGRVTDGDFRFSDGSPLDPPDADELYRLFS